jgi:hypothetical protein
VSFKLHLAVSCRSRRGVFRDPFEIVMMKRIRLSRLKIGVFALGLVVTALSSGCMEDNDAEFLKNAPPPPKNEFSGESYAEHRSRTRRISKAEQRYEAKRKAAAEKAAAEKAAAEQKAAP